MQQFRATTQLGRLVVITGAWTAAAADKEANDNPNTGAWCSSRSSEKVSVCVSGVTGSDVEDLMFC